MDKYFKLIKKFFETPCKEIKRTEEILKDLFSKLPRNEIALSLNGGKDSTVILFLALYFMQAGDSTQTTQRLKCVYMKEKNPFKEIISYLTYLKSNFSIEVYEYDNNGIVTHDFMKHALKEFVNTHKIKAMISGTRSTDPYCQNLDLIVNSDVEKGWPDILRVMPIYMWTYEQVWSFILKNELPYCTLYNTGYTYVGDQINSIPNPFLYLQPAWHANDNIELFSRTTLFNRLPRKDNKLYFNGRNTLLLVVKDALAVEKLAPDDFTLIKEEIRRFSDRQGCIVEELIPDPRFVNDGVLPVDIKNRIIIEMKRLPGNYDKLYLVIVYSPKAKSVLFIGF